MHLDQLLRLAELGYKLFPLLAGSKHPNGRLAPSGRNDATSDPEKIKDWHRKAPMSNWGLATDGLLVIDIDGKDNPWPADPELAADLAECGALAITGRGGRHHIYSKPDGKGWRSTAGKLADHVDTRSCGGYIVLAGSTVTNDGKACTYNWVDGMELSSPPDELPPPPPWLIEQLDQLGHRPAGGGNGARAADQSKFPEGRRNDGMFRIACSLRRMGMQELEILAALLTANENRCDPPLDESEVESIAERAATYEPDQLATDLVSGELDDIDISALIKESVPDFDPEHHDDLPKQKDPGAFPEHLLNPGGYIGQFIEYVKMTAHRDQPVLALAAGISLQSLAIGRRIADPIGTRPNIYVLGVAPSGQGKEAARVAIKNILCEANAHAQLSEGVASHSGLITAIHKSPRMILLVDEIGRWLKTVASPAAGPHLYAIVTNLMKLFTSSNSIFIGDNYADPDKNKVINQPHCTLYGTTVPKSLYESLTEESISDGFLSRIFAMEGIDNAPRIKRAKPADTAQILKDLADGFSAWEALNRGNMPEDCFIPSSQQLVIATIENEASDLFEALQEEADQLVLNNTDGTRTLWTRCEEKARTLALIHACSRIGPPQKDTPYTVEITQEDAAWAIDLAKYLTKKLCWTCYLWIANGEFDARRRSILRYIIDKSPSHVTKTMLARRFSHIKSRDIREVLDVLLEAKLVVPKDIEGSKKGRKSTAYVAKMA